MLQKFETDKSYTQKNMVFDPKSTDKIKMRVNEYKYSQEDLKCNFSNANEDNSNAY